uniref:lactadherin-like n=1 Tax=Styela clava TaxID=7725 RepID=UPI00193AD8B7|nr:lactadherin-like [Styela clava]
MGPAFYILCSLLLVNSAFAEVTNVNVYEFCSAVLADSTAKYPKVPKLGVCNPAACRGRTGRKGSRGDNGKDGMVGQKGDPGIQGPKGEPADSRQVSALEEKVRMLEEKLDKRFDLIPKLLYCSMGMKNYEIQTNAITSSSDYDIMHSPYFGRLDAIDERSLLDRELTDSESWRKSVGAWCPKPKDPVPTNEWIQIDLGSSMSVGGIVTQGRPVTVKNDQHWVETYKVSCGTTADNMEFISEDGVDKIFTGNSDNNSKVIGMFPQSKTCRYVRIYPRTYNEYPCMRLELIRGECHDLF